tara:strand:- start:89 stop:502 length:414 start_codon:yes stop_codon:yes gene_type:complete
MKSNQWGGAYYHPYLDTIGTRARPGQERQKGSPYEPSDIFRGDMIHELQHGIQERTKGWQSGSHPAEFVGSNIRDKETGKKLNKVELYRRTAGEAEARLADFRKDFTDEQRSSNPPWTAAGGLDRPESKLIFRNNYD